METVWYPGFGGAGGTGEWEDPAEAGISMPLILAKSTQEVFLADREAELAKGGSF